MARSRILLVDDDDFIHKLIGKYLREQDYEVIDVYNGRQALEVVRDALPDAVLTDVQMPELDGLELTKRLRAHHKTARLPIIMFSSLAEASHALKGYAEGADEYLAKPFELALLGAKIESLLRLSASGLAASANGRVIAVMHGKGGVGATTVAVNLAATLSKVKGAQVGLLDLNLEFHNAAVYLNLRPQQTLADLTSFGTSGVDSEAFRSFVTAHPPSLVNVVIGCNTPERTELVGVPSVQFAIDQLRAANDYVVIDAPANFTETTLAAVDGADLICLVTAPTIPAMKATADCIGVFTKLGIPREKVMLVLNRVNTIGASDEDLSRFFARPADASISHSDEFDHSANLGSPLVLVSPAHAAAVEFSALAEQVVARW